MSEPRVDRARSRTSVHGIVGELVRPRVLRPRHVLELRALEPAHELPGPLVELLEPRGLDLVLSPELPDDQRRVPSNQDLPRTEVQGDLPSDSARASADA